MSFKPVIFLAFANDKVDQASYLRNLAAEMHGIRKALGEAVSSGLCEVVERSSASISEILDVFQDPVYGPRISIFHYGGHADGFSLLLESADGSQALAHKEGLVPYLARQENLKLIFLNGCSSEGQATDLLKAGIPAVIGTTTYINDEVATKLAIRFYSSLGDGSGIEKAWLDATDEAKISSGTSNTRALYWEGKKEFTDRFPWIIQFKLGAGIIKNWNLPDVSGNPLYGLPPIIQKDNLPESPFLYLKRYERRHAEVFFGRSNLIRNLYTSVNDRQAPPIILLYGQSGAGKSSILESGLQPRLESGFYILYLRRNATLGLSGTVYNALLEACGFHSAASTVSATDQNDPLKIADDLRMYAEKLNDPLKAEINQLIDKLASFKTELPGEKVSQEASPKEICAAWKLVEQKFEKPLIIILDQIEEAYTRPNEHLGNEMNQFFLELKKVFGNAISLPLGKIILSFRKEFHPEIEEYCKNYELPRSKRYIEHLTKSEVLEIFKGFAESQRFKTRYNLTVEEGLPELIAADLTSDKETPVAPMLQILLTKMWIKALSMNKEGPRFTHELYRGLKEEGLAMDEFLQHQLAAIKIKLPDLYQNGFVLDLLGLYCTSNGTAATVTQKQLLDNYPGAGEAALSVLAICQERSLITELGGSEKSAVLAHDTLAKSVVKLQQRATRPLQQAKRILSSSMEAVRSGSEFTTLDAWELKLIDRVKNFLPAFSDDERLMIGSSREAIAKKEREKNRILLIKRVAGSLVLISSVAVWLLYLQSRKNETESYINMMTASSGLNLGKDHTLAMQQALYGFHLKGERSNREANSALCKAYYYPVEHQMPWYKTIGNSGLNYLDLIENNESKLMIPFAESDSLNILDYQGNDKGFLVTSPVSIGNMEAGTTFIKLGWSRDGRTIVAINSAGMIQFHDASGQLKKVHGGAGENYFDFDISPISNKVVTFRRSSLDPACMVQLFDLEGNPRDSFASVAELRDIHFNVDGEGLIPERNGGLDHTLPIQIIDQQGIAGFTLNARGPELNRMTKSPKGNYMVFRGYQNGIFVYDRAHTLIQTIEYNKFYDEYSDNINVVFHPSDSFLALRYSESEVRIYPVIKRIDAAGPVILKHEQTVSCIRFSEDGKSVLTGSADHLARIWDMQGKELYRLAGHTDDVTGGKFFDDERRVITCSADGSVRSWQLDHFQDIVLAATRGPEPSVDFDASVKYAVSSGADNTFRVLDLENRKQIVSLYLEHDGLKEVGFIDSSLVLGITAKDSVFLYRLADGKTTRFRTNTRSKILFAAPMGDKIIAAGTDSISYWDQSGRELKSFLAAEHLNGRYAIHADSMLAVSTYKGPVLLYGYSGDFLGELAGHESLVDDLDFSPDGRYLISVASDQTVVWDLQLNKFSNLKLKLCDDYEKSCPFRVRTAHFSNSGDQIVTACEDRQIKVWDLQGNLISTMVGHDKELKNAFFSPDDKMIYSFSLDGTLRLWDLAGKEIATYNHKTSVIKAIMNREETVMYSAGDDGTIRFWLSPKGIYRDLKQSSQFLLADPDRNNSLKWLQFPGSKKI